MEVDQSPPKSERRKKKSVRATPRGHPEGNSVIQKHAPQAAAPSPKKKAAKKPKKHKLSDDEFDVDDTAPLSSPPAKRFNASQDSGESDIDLDESLGPQVEKQRQRRKIREKKIRSDAAAKKEEVMETDVSFEQAVEKARGLPDGALADGPMNSTEVEPDTAGSDGKKDKRKSLEKGKKKPLNVC